MAKNWAVVIGINNYNPNNFSQLNYAKRDAELVRDFFQDEAGFDEVCYFSDDSHELVLPNGTVIPTQPTFGNLISFLEDRFKSSFLSTGDNCWFFFAGHGAQHNNRDYLMPIDANPRVVEQTAITVNYLRERLCRSGADNIVLILDACRNEGSRSSSGIGNEPQQGIITIYACNPTQKSWEVEALQQGVFTYALLEALRIPGERNCATVERLNQYLCYRVPELCRQYSKFPEQNPRISADPATKLHFILMPQYAMLTDIATLKNDGYRTYQLDNDLDLAEKIWIRVVAATLGRDMEAIRVLQKIAQIKTTRPFKSDHFNLTDPPSGLDLIEDREMPLPVEDMIPPSLARDSSSIDSLREDTGSDPVNKIEYYNPTHAEDSAILFRQLDNPLARTEQPNQPFISEPCLRDAQDFQQDWESSNYIGSQQTITLSQQAQLKSRTARRKFWSIFGTVGVSAVAAIVGFNWWHNHQMSRLSDIHPLPSESPSSPNPPTPQVNVKTDATGIVTAYATEKLSRGDLLAGLGAVEELLNRGALNNAQAALSVVSNSLADDPSVNFFKGRLAWQFVQTGDKKYNVDDSRRFWENAVRAKPDSLLYTNALGFAYYAESDLNRANDSWFKALNVAVKQQNANTTTRAVAAPPPTPRQDTLTSYAGLALGLYKTAPSQSAAQREQYLKEAIKVRQMVVKDDPVNFKLDQLSKNWLWTEAALKDWRSLLQLNSVRKSDAEQ